MLLCLLSNLVDFDYILSVFEGVTSYLPGLVTVTASLPPQCVCVFAQRPVIAFVNYVA